MPFVANEWMQAAIWRSTSLSSSLLPASFVLWLAGYCYWYNLAGLANAMGNNSGRALASADSDLGDTHGVKERGVNEEVILS